MSKKLLVRTPVTRDGVNLVYDENKQPVYKESIVELTAKRQLESLNSSLPEILRHELKEVTVEEDAISDSNEQLKKKLENLEKQDEATELRKRIAELEAKLAGTTADSHAPGTPAKAKAEEVIAQITAATSADAVKALVEGETRKTVQEAATKRIAELEAK